MTLTAIRLEVISRSR